MKIMTKEEVWKKTVADMQTEIHELQMMVVRLQEKLNKLQINNSENDSNPLSGPEYRQRYHT
tara:strand:+ start:495 stop:680 length:186 start_codon:yes stop_codon:yes gene_type:complete